MTALSPLPERVVDVECFRNYFLIGITDVATLTHIDFEWPLDAARCARVLRESCIVTFNGNKYDAPMMAAALAGHPPAMLKQMSDAIIQQNLQPWQFYQQWNVVEPELDHVDLFEVAPGQASLKIYGGRLHSKRMQDLPLPHDAEVIDTAAVRHYCTNDRLTTIDLLEHLRPRLEIRVELGREYGLDLRSKSDAQMGEAIMRHEAGGYVSRPVYAAGTQIGYRPPPWIQFQTEGLRHALQVVVSSPFTVVEKPIRGDESNLATSLSMHPDLAALQVVIARNAYTLGMGGVHSQESCTSHHSDGDYEIADYDVASYYPRLIDLLEIEPPQLKGVYRRVFKGWISRRLAAKAAGDALWSSVGKILTNGGGFGKLGSKYSIMYHPESMVRVTLTGQLALMMLIEALELVGIAVVNANTDGLVIRCPKRLAWLRDHVVDDWQRRTGLLLEATPYRALYSRDVNNYLAVKPDGKVKGKGAYTDEGIAKNPTNLVCLDAVVAYLTRGIPIGETIGACQDIRRFVTIRKVDGGAVKNGHVIGKSIRWYMAKDEIGAIHYATSGNTVPTSEGARPILELPDSMPEDVDRMWYCRKAVAMLSDLGVSTI